MNLVFYSQRDDVAFIVATIVLCLVGRVVNICGLSYIWNHCCIKGQREEESEDEWKARVRRKRIPIKTQLMTVHAGLRGAISFWLAFEFPSHHRRRVIEATMWVCTFTVFVMGGTVVPAMRMFLGNV